MKRLSSCVTVLLVVSLLAACASRPPAEPIVLRPVVRTAPEPIRHKASFDCTQTSSALQDVICGDTALSSLDRDMFEAYRANLRSVDLVGRMQLVANQRYWLLSRASKCKVSSRRLGGTKPNAANVGCLTSTYRGRIGELKAWPQPSSQPQVRKTDGAGKFHPLSAYVEFRLVDGRDGALCSSLGRQFNNAIADRGEVNFAHINGSTQIAGTHGAAKGSANGVNYSVSLYDAGPYASYQLRAVGLDINGQNVIHDHSMGDWVSQLPNSGGRFGNTSSQTRDYASVDVFQTQQRTFALVSEAWGYYSAAALGESAYAGVYDLGSGSAQPLCLYSTYLTPPITRTSDRLPAFKELEQLLSRMTGEPPQLEMDERRDEGLLERETEWILFNLPLVAIGEIERFGRQAALRQRHDMAIDAIWNWSERNLPSKLLYRRMLPMMQPAYDELLITFQQGQGLKPDEARAAADLVIMDLIDRAAENLSDFYAAKAAPLAPFAQYTHYLGNLLKGDFGLTTKYEGWTVLEIIGGAFPISLQLGLLGMAFALTIGLPVGIIAAARKNSTADWLPMSISMLGICLPTFVMGPLLALGLGLKLNLFNVAGWYGWSDRVLPSLTLGLFYAAYIARMTRAGMLEVLSRDFVRTARAKGVSETAVLLRHSLKIGLTPVIAFLGPAMAGMVTGSFVV